MQFVRGTVRNVHVSAAAPTSSGAAAAFVDFEIDGRTIRLEMAGEQSPWAPGDGDEVIVAGERQAARIVGYAYKDLTQGYLGRVSVRQDVTQGGLVIILAGLFLWLGVNANSEVPLFFWAQRITFLVLGAAFVLFAAVYLLAIVQKLQATFVVTRASIETVRGVVRGLEPAAGATDSEGSAVRMELDGRPIQVVMRPGAVREGDEMVVAGEVAGDVLSVVAYRNVTRSILGRTFSFLGIVPSLLLIGFILLMLGLWWLDGESQGLDIASAARWILTVVIGLGTMVFTLERFFQWWLRLETYRRVKHL